MKKRGVLLGALSLALATGLAVPSVFAATNESSSSSKSTYGVENGRPVITPFSFGNNWSGNTSGSTITSSSFFVPTGYGHVKLYFLNKGAGTVTISVKHVTSGMIYFTENVAPGKSFTWRSYVNYPQGMRGGDYIVSYHCGTANVNVDYAGFASNNVEETKS